MQALVVDKNGVVYAATNPDGKVYRIERGDKGAASKDKTELEKGKASALDSLRPSISIRAQIHLGPGSRCWRQSVCRHRRPRRNFRVTAKGEHSRFLQERRSSHPRAGGRCQAEPDRRFRRQRTGLSDQAQRAKALFSTARRKKKSPRWPSTRREISMPPGWERSTLAAFRTIFTPPIATPVPALRPGRRNPGAVVLECNSDNLGAGERHSASWSRGHRRFGNLPHRARRFAQPHLGFAGRPGLCPGFRSCTDVCSRAPATADMFLPSPAKTASPICSMPAPRRSRLSPKLRAADFTLRPAIWEKFSCWGRAVESEGSYESDVFDAQIFSRWGRVEFRGTGNIELFARSGNVDNPDRNWSPWKPVDLQKDPALNVPPARFMQWKAVLHAGATAPSVDSVLLNYLPKNVAPDFDDVTVQAGVRYQPLPKPVD